MVIRVPKENVSDDSCKLIELMIENGDKIKKDDILCILETSKASFELRAPINGYVFYKPQLKLNESILVGDPIFIIDNKSKLKQVDEEILKSSKKDALVIKNQKVIVSKDAQKLINKHTININEIAKKGLIKKLDVEKYIAEKNLVGKENNEFEKLNIKSNKKNIIIVGAGGHAKVLIDIILRDKSYNLLGVVDAGSIIGNINSLEQEIMNIPVICDNSGLQRLLDNGVNNAVNAVGFLESSVERNKVFKRLKKLGFTMPNIIHKNANIESSATLGEGNHILANAVVGSNSIIGNNCIINSGSILTHDIKIGDNTHITPGALLAGYVKIGSDTIIGMGVKVYFKVNIGSNVKVHNGCNIFGNLLNGEVVKY